MTLSALPAGPSGVESGPDILRWSGEIAQLALARFGSSVAVVLATRSEASTSEISQRWNDLAFPEIDAAGGIVARSTGRTLVALFDRPRAALDAAIQLQLTFESSSPGGPPNLPTSVVVGWGGAGPELLQALAGARSAWRGGQIAISQQAKGAIESETKTSVAVSPASAPPWFEVAWRGANRRRTQSQLPQIDPRYTIESMVGSGGMASVWRARDERLARTVAVKVLHRHLDLAPRARERFRREAQIAASLVHDNVVQVFDYSDANAQESFIAMEMVEGRSLRRYLTGKGPLPEVVATAIGHEIARGLAYAHSRSVVHRDCKPDNVLLSNLGAVKLGDFGIAGVQEMARLTATGGAVGSPAYMAPEQLEGSPPTPGNDVFGLGVTLYEMAVGRPPFDGQTPATVMRQVVNGTFVPPEQLAPVGSALSQVISKALARDAAQRYPDAQAMLQDLRELLDARGVGDPRMALSRFLAIDDPVMLAEVASRFSVEITSPSRLPPKSKLPALVLGAVGLLALLGIGIAWGALSRKAPPPVSEVVAEVVPLPPPMAGPAVAPPAPLPVPVALPPPPAVEAPKAEPKRESEVVPPKPMRSHRARTAQAVEPAPAPGSAPGEVDIWVSPWADGITLDGELKGTGRPPPLKAMLSPGKHHLQVTNPHLKTFSGDIDVPSGKSLRIRVDLQAGLLSPQP